MCASHSTIVSESTPGGKAAAGCEKEASPTARQPDSSNRGQILDQGTVTDQGTFGRREADVEHD